MLWCTIIIPLPSDQAFCFHIELHEKLKAPCSLKVASIFMLHKAHGRNITKVRQVLLEIRLALDFWLALV
jgi:hypothetical protein